ncbi:MAG: 3-deoxy-D-manno-octulosonic acid transferase, partial [Cryomorphaceae bacterium]
MTLLYRLGIALYGTAARFTSWWNPKARLWVSGRKNVIGNIERECSEKRPTIWMHCPSLGEFEQGRPLWEALRELYPEYRGVITFFSPSGFEVQKEYPHADHIFYLPEDTPGNAKRFVQALQPSLALFVKYDFWLHYLESLKTHGCTTLLVSGIFRPNQHFFGSFPALGNRMLNCFDYFFVQNEESEKLLRNKGFTHVQKTGDTRFDRVLKLSATPPDIQKVGDFCQGHKTVVAGSTWPADIQALLPFLKEGDHGFRMIIAPHEVHKAAIQQLLETLPVKSALFSVDEAITDNTRVLVIDSIGMLSRLYHFAHVAYVGGGFGKSIHNLSEAAAWGVPVVFGP